MWRSFVVSLPGREGGEKSAFFRPLSVPAAARNLIVFLIHLDVQFYSFKVYIKRRLSPPLIEFYPSAPQRND